MFPHGETITVVRRSGTDRWGQPLPATESTVAGCGLAPRGRTEETYQRNTVITGLTLYGPPGVDIRASDVIVRADGSRWQVIGEVGVWSSPLTGRSWGVEVALERVTG